MRVLSRSLSCRLTVLSAVFACACPVGTVSLAAPPAALAGSGVATVPADAAFFSSTLRLQEQVNRFMATNAWAKLRTLPVVARALDSWEEQKDTPGSGVSMFLTYLELPENAEAVALLSDMVARDTFVYGEPTCTDFVKLVRIVMAAQQSAAIRGEELDMEEEDFEEAMELEDEISGGPGRLRVFPVSRQPGVFEDAVIDDDIFVPDTFVSGDIGQAMAVIDALADNIDLIKVPDVVWGFKTDKKEAAAFQIERIEVLAKLLSEISPEAAKAMARRKVAGGEVLTFTLSGSLVPWDDLAQMAEDEIGGSENLDKVLAKVREIDIVIALGIIGDWVVLSVGDSIDHLDKLVVPGSKGKSLIETPPFAKLVEHADKPLTGIAYLSEELAGTFAASKEDFEPMISGAVLAVDASDEAAEEIEEWLETVVDEYITRLPKPGAMLSYSFMTPKGYEGYSWQWSDKLPFDGRKRLSLLDHTGGTPVAVAVSRMASDPSLIPSLRRIFGDGKALLAKYADPEVDETYAAEFDTAMTLGNELATILTDKFLASLADGQVGLVLDAKATTDRIHVGLPSAAEPLPLPELAIVLPLGNRQLFVDGLNEFFAWGDKVVAEIRKVDPDAVPEGYRIPEPTREKIAAGSIWSFRIPDAGLDEQVAPAIGVGDKAAVFALTPGHAARLLAPAPLETGGVHPTFAGPLAAASAIDVPAVIDMIEPWVVYVTRYGCVMTTGGEVHPEMQLSADDETDEAADALAQIRVVLEVARCLRSVVSEMTVKDGAVVTHWQNLIEDLPKP